MSVSALEVMVDRERRAFAAARPRSQFLSVSAARHFAHAVPMHWMRDWPTPFPLYVAEAGEATLSCVDGHHYVDFCLGDTGAMFGHSPYAVAEALARQATQGLATMLPAGLAARVGEALAELFGLPWWQVTLTATDANRAVLRLARAITGRRRILVFNHCYHGTVDETLVVADQDHGHDGGQNNGKSSGGRSLPRPGLIGSIYDVSGTAVVEFNDLVAAESVLARGDIACVLTEPVMTNAGMVLPRPGFLEGLRAACDRHGALLVIDETHTLSCGLGGYARGVGLAADFLVCGKAIAGGMPAAVYGCTDAVARRIEDFDRIREAGHSGLGTTLSANPLSLAALHACLTQVMTPAAYAHMERLAGRLQVQLTAAFTARSLPWYVSRAGARLEFGRGEAPHNGTQSLARSDHRLESALHLYLLNRGFLLTPFHNMMLVSPVTTDQQVTDFSAAFGQCLDEFTQAGALS